MPTYVNTYSELRSRVLSERMLLGVNDNDALAGSSRNQGAHEVYARRSDQKSAAASKVSAFFQSSKAHSKEEITQVQDETRIEKFKSGAQRVSGQLRTHLVQLGVSPSIVKDLVSDLYGASPDKLTVGKAREVDQHVKSLESLYSTIYNPKGGIRKEFQLGTFDPKAAAAFVEKAKDLAAVSGAMQSAVEELIEDVLTTMSNELLDHPAYSSPESKANAKESKFVKAYDLLLEAAPALKSERLEPQLQPIHSSQQDRIQNLTQVLKEAHPINRGLLYAFALREFALESMSTLDWVAQTRTMLAQDHSKLVEPAELQKLRDSVKHCLDTYVKSSGEHSINVSGTTRAEMQKALEEFLVRLNSAAAPDGVPLNSSDLVRPLRLFAEVLWEIPKAVATGVGVDFCTRLDADPHFVTQS